MNPIELAQRVGGKSDAELAKQIGGIDAVIDEVASNMAASFDPSAAAGEAAVIQYEIATKDGPKYLQLSVANGVCKVSRELNATARVSLALGYENFLRLVCGELKGQQAYFAGKLKVSGDLMFSQNIEKWFTPAM